MTPTFLKPIALQAKRALASANLEMGSSHLHELLAALHGFNTAIAFRGYVERHVSPDDPPFLVCLDTTNPLDRCRALKPDVDAQRVVGELMQALRQTLDASSIYLDLDRDSDSLVAFVRRTVLREPQMQGVVDNAEKRLQDSCAAGFAENATLRSMTLSAGPVEVSDVMGRLVSSNAVLEAKGTYIDRDEEDGSFDFRAEFEERRPRLYALAHAEITFRPGEFEDDDLIMEFQHPSSD